MAHTPTSPVSPESAQFIHVGFRVPLFPGLQRFFPAHFAPRVGGGAGHDARKRRLPAFVGLIVEIPTDDAVDECLLFFTVRKFEVRRELPRRGKRRLPRVFGDRSFGLPRLLAQNPERSGIRRLRRAARSEKAFRHLPPAFRELGRTKGDVNAIGIVKQHVVVSIGVSIGGPPNPPPPRPSLHPVGLPNPLAS